MNPHPYQQILDLVATYLPAPMAVPTLTIQDMWPVLHVAMCEHEGRYHFAPLELEKHVLSRNGQDPLYNPLAPGECIGDVARLSAAWVSGQAPPLMRIGPRAGLWLRRVAMMAVSDMMLNYHLAHQGTGT